MPSDIMQRRLVACHVIWKSSRDYSKSVRTGGHPIFTHVWVAGSCEHKISHAHLKSIGWTMLSSGSGGAMLGASARGAGSMTRSARCVLLTTRKGQ